MRLLKSLAMAAFFALLSAPLWALELVMVEQDGCVYCELWNEQISEIYPKTAEGKFAPLRRVDLFELDESGVAFERGVNFTPTFVVVDDGRELTRLEGYPGEDFFWFLLTKMLTETTSFTAEGS